MKSIRLLFNALLLLPLAACEKEDDTDLSSDTNITAEFAPTSPSS